MITKELICKLTIAGITLFAVYEVTKTITEKKYVETTTPNHPNTEPEEEPKTVVEKVKAKAKDAGKAIARAAKKMADKIKNSAIYEKCLYAYAKTLSFLIIHENEIRTLKEAVLLIAAFATLKGALKKGSVPRRTKPLTPFYTKTLAIGDGDLYRTTGFDDSSITDFVKYLGKTKNGLIRNSVIGDDKDIWYSVIDLKKEAA